MEIYTRDVSEIIINLLPCIISIMLFFLTSSYGRITRIFDLLCYSPWCLPKLMGESGNTIDSSKEIYPSLPVSSTMNFVDDEISGLHYVANKGTCPDLSRTGIDI